MGTLKNENVHVSSPPPPRTSINTEPFQSGWLLQTIAVQGHPSWTLLYVEDFLLKPQSHWTKLPLRQCKTGPTQYELVRRRRNAVETDKDVMRSFRSWLTWVNFEHVKKRKT